MHLVELLSLRPVPAAGVYLTLTRRCPLTCAHCSTNSMMDSEEHAADLFLRFAESLTPTDHPGVLALTGGEALLRPEPPGENVGYLVVKSVRPAAIYLNGKESGGMSNEGKIPLRPGKYEVALKHPRMRGKTAKAVLISRGKTALVLMNWR